jgi:hypothetical protein
VKNIVFWFINAVYFRVAPMIVRSMQPPYSLSKLHGARIQKTVLSHIWLSRPHLGEKRNAYRILVGKPEGTRPLGRPRYRCVDKIKMDLKRNRMGWYGFDWCGSGYEPVEGSCEHGNESSSSIKCWEVLEWLHNWQLLKKG